MKKLCESDFRFMCMIWDYEPLTSRDLTEKCHETLGWKRTTVYTMLKKMCEKGLAKNENTIVTSMVSKQEIQLSQSEKFLEETFQGSLPGFLAAFMSGKGLSADEADVLIKMIKDYREG